jgi:hypothetical protein
MPTTHVPSQSDVTAGESGAAGLAGVLALMDQAGSTDGAGTWSTSTTSSTAQGHKFCPSSSAFCTSIAIQSLILSFIPAHLHSLFDADSTVLFVNTEADTDIDVWKEIVHRGKCRL